MTKKLLYARIKIYKKLSKGEKYMSDLREIASNLTGYLNSTSPQVKERALQWYFSGSLATTVMASAESITEIQLDGQNNIVGEAKPKDITEQQRTKISTFVRKLGNDIDIVNVNGDFFNGAQPDNKPHIQNIIRNVPNVLELMSWPATSGRFNVYR